MDVAPASVRCWPWPLRCSPPCVGRRPGRRRPATTRSGSTPRWPAPPPSWKARPRGPRAPPSVWPPPPAPAGAQERVAEARARSRPPRSPPNTARRAVAEAQAAVDRAAAPVRRGRRRRAEAARERVAGFVSAAYKGGDLVSLERPAGLAHAAGPRAALRLRRPRSWPPSASRVDGLRRPPAAAAKQAAERRHPGPPPRRRRPGPTPSAALAAARDAQTRAEAGRGRAGRAGRRARRGVAGGPPRSARPASRDIARPSARRRGSRPNCARGRGRQRRRAQPGPLLRPGAKFLMPVHGWKSSDFGMRLRPVLPRLAAARRGRPRGRRRPADLRRGRRPVIRAGWNGGYGNYTCISHGRYRRQGLRTCYAHQSQILVWPGQQVRQRPGHRPGRHHRRLHRLPPALRGPPRRRPGQAAALAARLPLLIAPDSIVAAALFDARR